MSEEADKDAATIVSPTVPWEGVTVTSAAADVAVAAVRISLLHATSGSVIHHLKNGVRI